MPVTTETVKTYTTHDGKPFVEDTHLIPLVARFMSGNGYGQIMAIHDLPPGGDITSLHHTWYDGGDKNCFNLWGLDHSGKVICAFGSFQDKGVWKVQVCKMNATHDFPAD